MKSDSETVGGILVAGSFLWLLCLGRLDLLIMLIPLSLVLSSTLLWLGKDKNGADESDKEGVA